MHRKNRVTVIGMLLAALAFIPAANATLITSGQIEVLTPHTGRFNFDFMIGDLSVRGFTDEGSKLLLPGYEGDTFNGDHNRGIQDMFYGYVEDQFVLWREGSNPIVTTLFTTAPGAVLTAGQTLYQSTFEFQGGLCGIYSGTFGTPCDIVFPSLTGQGIAEFLFDESILDDGRHYFTPVKATYTFMPVPEPAALALFCVGLVGIAVTRRRQLFRRA
ncbi:PEP-CTERM sorting domain-containing protein [Steroidobacter agaridevorans]|uniref:PEP-CTERM sorting domain-containing protein n=1 Tax=Steroidobacter agaridevorans TaxID=2695856 RepID=UPI001321B432|nr:PEP-CTERM sorting domain-containing protein [Steroidobacter agaridevorans]GFE91564.1 hypothetical protein GCM10011488_65180 [Steroidobacter agaridevorans]